MLILKFRKYNNSLYKLSSDFQIVTVLGLQFIIFILQQLHNLITTALGNPITSSNWIWIKQIESRIYLHSSL